MQATTFEFKNRALLFGAIFFAAFACYALDSQNSTVVVANSLEHRMGWKAEFTAKVLLFAAALLVAAAALLRTWASAYLQANVVYASDIKTAALVADGPYRFVRNPLYFANVLMAAGMGAMLSRPGFVVCIAGMLVFCYRLIFREESELETAQAARYTAYLQAVPRLWPSLRPRLPASPQTAKWSNGFKAESWCWGFALAIAAFAITLQTLWFFLVMGISLGLFWIFSWILRTPSDKLKNE